MTDAQIQSTIDACKAAGSDPNKVEWNDLKAVLSNILTQTTLEDVTASEGQYLKFTDGQWQAAANDGIMPAGVNNGGVYTPGMRFSTDTDTGLFAPAGAGRYGMDLVDGGKGVVSVFWDWSSSYENEKGGISVLKGWGTNRFSIESFAAMVHISGTSRYEWEGLGGGGVLTWVGYDAGSSQGRTILVTTSTASGASVVPMAFKALENKDSIQIWDANNAGVGGFTYGGHPFLPTTTYANDTAAATGGVKVGGLYWNGSAITQRRA